VQRELTCCEFVGMIRLLRDDELNDVDRRSFSLHRQRCVRCSAYLKGYELIVRATRRTAEDSRRDSRETTMPKSLVSKILRARLKRPSGS
jgi:hypothetical protein